MAVSEAKHKETEWIHRPLNMKPIYVWTEFTPEKKREPVVEPNCWKQQVKIIDVDVSFMDNVDKQIK